MEFNREKNNEIIDNQTFPTDVVELYQNWLSLLNEYGHLTQETCPERVAYRQAVAQLLPKNLPHLDKYISNGVLTPEIEKELLKRMPFTGIKATLKPLEERLTNLQLIGLLYDKKVWDAVQSLNFSQFICNEFNLISYIELKPQQKQSQLYRVRELRRVCKEKWNGAVKVKSTIVNNQVKLEANLLPVYAQMLRQLHLPNLEGK